MKRKDYEKPAMQVVKIQHTGMLMTSVQGVTSKRGNYGKANEDVDESELDGEEWVWN